METAKMRETKLMRRVSQLEDLLSQVAAELTLSREELRPLAGRHWAPIAVRARMRTLFSKIALTLTR